MASNKINTVSDCVDGCSLNATSSSASITADILKKMIPQLLLGQWENLTFPLSDWQISQLDNLEEAGVSCLLNMWFINQQNLTEGTYCNATWDNVHCWPPTPTGQVVTTECSKILEEMKQPYANQIEGTAFRVCTENGTWLKGNWTNYTQCADSYDQYIQKTDEEQKLVVAVQHMLFVGSLLSLACLGVSLAIFFYFKCLWCDRVTVHIHLMVALILRSALLIVITEPFIFNRTNHYRNEDFICKTVLSMNLYATAASINWMFVHGVYLHGKLTTNVFDKGTPPFKIYYVIGWVLPMILIGVYATVMETLYPVKCWKDYSERPELWILLGPMIVALVANLLFLLDIMRILLTKVQRSSFYSDGTQYRRAIKATMILFPLLGVTNLLFLYNPGGAYNKYYVVCNTFLGSTQGIFVSIFYCFVSRDVRNAVRRQYRRIMARRSGNATQGNNRLAVVAYSGNGAHHRRTHFRSKLVATPRLSRSDGNSEPRASEHSQIQQAPVENSGRVGSAQSFSPSLTSPYLSCCNCVNGGCCHNPVQLQIASTEPSQQQSSTVQRNDLRYDF